MHPTSSGEEEEEKGGRVLGIPESQVTKQADGGEKETDRQTGRENKCRVRRPAPRPQCCETQLWSQGGSQNKGKKEKEKETHECPMKTFTFSHLTRLLGAKKGSNTRRRRDAAQVIVKKYWRH